MPLLLIPFVILLLAALALLLWPIGLWQRYRLGRARRKARPWLVAFNAVVLLVSTLLFLLGAGVAGMWIEGALPNALLGLLAGAALGGVGLWLTRFEDGNDSVHYTANAWLILALTLLVALRVALGAWQAWYRWWEGVPAPVPWPWLADYASLLAMAGLLIGYHAVYAFGLWHRMRRFARRMSMRLRR